MPNGVAGFGDNYFSAKEVNKSLSRLKARKIVLDSFILVFYKLAESQFSLYI